MGGNSIARMHGMTDLCSAGTRPLAYLFFANYWIWQRAHLMEEKAQAMFAPLIDAGTVLLRHAYIGF